MTRSFLSWSRRAPHDLELDFSRSNCHWVAERGRLAAAYGDATYHRLVALKDRHDPGNVFRLNQNIPPATIGKGAGAPKPAGTRV